MHAVAIGAIAAATFAPSMLISYRCLMMGTTMSSPCCDEARGFAGGDAAQLRAEPCCTRVVVDWPRAPLDMPAQGDVRLQPPVFLADVEPPLDASAPAPWLRAQMQPPPDPGPPILLRICRLVI